MISALLKVSNDLLVSKPEIPTSLLFLLTSTCLTVLNTSNYHLFCLFSLSYSLVFPLVYLTPLFTCLLWVSSLVNTISPILKDSVTKKMLISTPIVPICLRNTCKPLSWSVCKLVHHKYCLFSGKISNFSHLMSFVHHHHPVAISRMSLIGWILFGTVIIHYHFSLIKRSITQKNI